MLPTGPSQAAIWNWGRAESAAIREVAEETGFVITAPSVIAVTNNLETWRESGLHYISVTLLARVEGEPQLLEPEKCEGWIWCDPRVLQSPTSMPVANR